MADFVSPSLTTAVAGVTTITSFQVQSTSSYVVEVSNGTVSLGNLSGSNYGILSSTIPGWLTGRRPVDGQLFPRGVYNK
jgi:hypothetical protein